MSLSPARNGASANCAAGRTLLDARRSTATAVPRNREELLMFPLFRNEASRRLTARIASGANGYPTCHCAPCRARRSRRQGIQVVVQILGVWTVLAVFAAGMTGRAIRSGRRGAAPARLPLPFGPGFTAAAAGSAVAELGVFAVAVQSLPHDMPENDVVLQASAEPDARPAPQVARTPTPPTALQDLTARGRNDQTGTLPKPGDRLSAGEDARPRVRTLPPRRRAPAGSRP